MKYLILFFVSAICFFPIVAMQKEGSKITFSSQFCEKDFPARISSYRYGNMMVCKIEDLEDATIEYKLYELSEDYKISERDGVIFVWDQTKKNKNKIDEEAINEKKKKKPRSVYKSFENSYKIQQNKLKKQNKSL